MKVEFWESPDGKPELRITASEFKKGQKDKDHFDSLVHATTAFGIFFNVDNWITKRDFDFVCEKLRKGDIVVFTFEESGEYTIEIIDSEHHISRIISNGKPMIRARIATRNELDELKKMKARNKKEAKKK